MKIDFHYLTDFKLSNEIHFSDWINRIISFYNKSTSNICFIFCDDTYLNKINLKYLNHDNFTDIITFNYCNFNSVSGDIFISIDRIQENHTNFGSSFDNEIKRVMSHGILHLIGFNDKTLEEKKIMSINENKMIELFHVEL